MASLLVMVTTDDVRQQQPETPVPAAKYYSPRLDRDLIATLYHTAKSRRVPMTQLASALVREGLARWSGDAEASCSILREEPPAIDPGRSED